MSNNDAAKESQVTLSSSGSVDANVIALPVRSVGCLLLPDFGEHSECGLSAPPPAQARDCARQPSIDVL